MCVNAVWGEGTGKRHANFYQVQIEINATNQLGKGSGSYPLRAGQLGNIFGFVSHTFLIAETM